MKPDRPGKSGPKVRPDRETRLAEALRENLRRRKAAASGTGKPKAIKNNETH